MARVNRVLRVCEEIFQRVLAVEPDFQVEVRMGRADEFPEARNFAYCVDQEPLRVVYAPKMVDQPRARIYGVMAHEIAGHALHFWQGRKTHSERAADALAERVCRVTISYDPEIYVQTTDPGIHPRPEFLG